MTPERISDLSPQSSAIQAPLNFDGLSYEEYFKKVDEMIGSVREHWIAEQRVKSLKVVIQLAKLLADTSQLKLYGKKYKMVVDLLNEFGKLVCQRLYSLATTTTAAANRQIEPPTISSASSSSTAAVAAAKITASHLNRADPLESARERAHDTCRNWLMKVASIRELVPRFYTELAILGCCEILFLGASSSIAVSLEQLYSQSLMRLTRTAWGFGDPIVALHARAYLCKVANQLISWTENTQQLDAKRSVLFEIVRANLRASVIVVTHLNHGKVTRALKLQTLGVWTFFELVSGALQSICNIITHKDDLYTNEDELSDKAAELFESLLTDSLGEIRRVDCSLLATNTILHSIIRSMPAGLIVKHHRAILDIIASSYDNWIEFKDVMEGVRQTVPTFYPTLESLALALDASCEFEKIETFSTTRGEILTFARRIIKQLVVDDLKETRLLRPHYLRCFKAWLSYANHYLEPNEVDTFLQEFVEQIQHDRQYVNHHTTILELIKALMSGKRSIDEFKRVFSMKSFQSLLELLKRDELRLEASRLIFETMRIELKLGKKVPSTASGGGEKILIADRRMIDFIGKLFTNINDSLGLQAADDDIVQLSELILLFIEIIFIPDHVERLEFLSKCRSSLCNLNPVLEHLAREALKLAADYRRSERRRTMRRNYLNGCLAFTFITIPALNNPQTRLELLILGSSLALDLMSLSLADYYLKQTLVNLNDLAAVATAASGPRSGSISGVGGVGGVGGGGSSKPSPADQKSNDDTHQSKERPVIHQEGPTKSRSSTPSKQLVGQVKSVVSLMMKHQDYIDLRHKLALSDLIQESSLSEHDELVEQSKFLKLVDDIRNESNSKERGDRKIGAPTGSPITLTES